MPLAKLREFLDSNRVKYQLTSHPLAYTAQGTAASSHVGGDELAKTVIIRVDDVFAMAVLPASRRIDLAALQAGAGAQSIRLASELEFKDLFPDCETGAMPPFGNLYGLAVFVDQSMAERQEIAFNAGSHTELIRLAFGDFTRLVKPLVLKFALAKSRAAAAAAEDRLW
jgi:Ala-tRNA(Pro) deacylase